MRAAASLLQRPVACDLVIGPEHDDGTDYGHDQTPDVETRDAGRTEGAEDQTANDGADDAQHDIHDHALAGLVDDLAADEAGDKAENDPADNAHCSLHS